MDVSPALNPWLLPALILVPFFGGLLAWYAERWSLTWPRWIGLLSMAATCVLAVWIWAHAGVAPVVPPHGSPEWIIEFRAGWIPRWGVSFHLGIDGLGLLMVLLTGVLGVLSVACSWREIQQYVGFFPQALFAPPPGLRAVQQLDHLGPLAFVERIGRP